ncbi:MAG: hypothetical protein CMF52_02625 [Legionellales bacterium]|nr:hypothetical protein [Legionellales bacterium]|tara:strand:+ start:675 stop:1505 length:831 start_codon:yes stop_codon:yes gene_type:complete
MWGYSDIMKGNAKVKEKIRIAVLTQKDSFVIPKNIKLLHAINGVELVAVAQIESKGSVVNKKELFLKGFGVLQTLKMGVFVSANFLVNLIDAACFYKLGFMKSIQAVANYFDTEYKVIYDPNCSNCVEWLRGLNIDLIVSYSAPCLFKKHLLELPRHGCINLHCSLLPKYAGLLPSFWALYLQPSPLGATVHRMDDKIDNGALLSQIEVPVPSDPTMFSVIKSTKRAGGLLMVSVINDILTGSLEEKENLVSEDDYFSWPSVEQIRDFRANGGRLI